jgi:CheY-like chemotaxis protein
VATILIVDDEVPIRELVAEVLAENGHQVLQASNGREALELLSSEVPQLVLTDVMMPLVNGIELVRAMKSTPQLAEVPVVLMTAAARQPAIDIGQHGLLEKPFTLDALEALVRRVLSPPSSRAG